jgi:nicotinamidase-related amidase
MKIIAIIDPQYAFINGVLGSKEAEIAADNIAKYLRDYDDPETLVLYTKDTHYENYLETAEGKALPIPHAIAFTPGWSIFKPISKEVDLNGKFYSYSAENVRQGRIIKSTFGSEELIKILKDIFKEYVIDSIEFMGFCTDVCVVSNVLMTKTALPETPIKVRANCCAGTTPEAHKAALTVMRSCQIEII